MTALPERLQIVQISAFYPPHLGGVERVTKSVAESLAARHQVSVITTAVGAEKAQSRQRSGAVTVHRHTGVCVAHTPISPGLALHVLRIDRDAIVHAHVAQAFIPDVLLVASLLRGLRYVAHFHLNVEPSGRLGKLLDLYKRCVFGPFIRRADQVIVLSDQQARFVRHRYRVPADRITVVPNGVDDEFYSVGDSADHAALPRVAVHPAVTRLLFVGRLDVQKNVARLIAAMSLVCAPTELVIVGDGEQRRMLEQQIAERKLHNVRLVGQQRGDDLLRWYAWADAFVLPSDQEGMPLVLLEAMAARLPIIATDVPGVRELVGDVGLLVEPTPPALARAIDAVATNPALRASLADASRQRGADFRWDASISAIEQVYRQVMTC